MFLPSSVSSPQSLDAGMRAALADSLAHVHAAAAERLSLPDVDFAAALSEIRTHRVRPGVFGRYYDLVFALKARRHDDARALFREIADLAAERPTLGILPFGVETLGDDAERYARLLSLEAESAVELAPPAPGEWLAFQQSVAAALQLIEEADPALAAELRAVVTEIVGAVTAPNYRRGFGGASSFMLWGAVLLNASCYHTRLDMLAALVHEAAHQLLFGHSFDEPLVENATEERYNSPLRSDPRPMDGIYHATFVCARMYYGYARVIEGAKSSLSEAEGDLIEQRLRDYKSKFFDGLETVQRFGRVTAIGDRIMDAAADYMRSAG